MAPDSAYLWHPCTLSQWSTFPFRKSLDQLSFQDTPSQSSRNSSEEEKKEIRKSSDASGEEMTKKNSNDQQKVEDSRQSHSQDSTNSNQAPEDVMQNFMKEALKMMQKQNMNSFNSNNILLNMNLHPPLVPPGLLPPHGPDPFTAFLMQAQASQHHQHQQQKSLSSLTPFEQQILKKLGIDPEAVKQAGLDPKLLVHLANMDPKAAVDPKILAMMMQKPSDATSSSPAPATGSQKMMQLGMDKPMGLFPGRVVDPNFRKMITHTIEYHSRAFLLSILGLFYTFYTCKRCVKQTKVDRQVHSLLCKLWFFKARIYRQGS